MPSSDRAGSRRAESRFQPEQSRVGTTKQVALIRGINVGKAKRVPMAGLRDALADLGFQNVRTLLNSGNVVFDATRAPKWNAARIERAIDAAFGVSARVLGLSADALAKVVDENPLADVATDPSRLLVCFFLEPSLDETPGAESPASEPPAGGALGPLIDRDWGAERLAVGSLAAYLWCPGGILASDLVRSVGAALGDDTTTRSWRTVLRLEDLAEA